MTKKLTQMVIIMINSAIAIFILGFIPFGSLPLITDLYLFFGDATLCDSMDLLNHEYVRTICVDNLQIEFESMECPICLQICVHPSKLPCGHIFCFLCVKVMSTTAPAIGGERSPITLYPFHL